MKAIIWVLAVVLVSLAGYYVLGERSDFVSGVQESLRRASQAAETEPYIALWRSVDDVKYSREFRADGAVVDRYDGDQGTMETGVWHVVDRKDETMPYSVDEKTTVLKLSFAESDYYFSVATITETELQLAFLDRGGMLRYTRER